MGMIVRTNIMAINANNNLTKNNSSVAKSLEKLSSGFRINRAADDASGLAMSEKMKAQIKALDTAAVNCEDGISLIQTAEGYTTEIHDMLNRMVELSEKSSNGTMETVSGGTAAECYSGAATDRQALQDEMDQLCAEIDRIAQTASFNNLKLFDGTLSSGEVVGVGGADRMAEIASDDFAKSISTIDALLSGGTYTGITPANVTAINNAATDADKLAALTAADTEIAALDVNDPLRVAYEQATAANAVAKLGADAATAETAANTALEAFATAINSATEVVYTPATDADISEWKNNIISIMATGTASEKSAAIKKYISENAKLDAATKVSSSDLEAALTDLTAADGALTAANDALETATASYTPQSGVGSNLKLQIGETDTGADKLIINVDKLTTDCLFKNIAKNITYTGTGSGLTITVANDTSTFSGGITLNISNQDAASSAAVGIREAINSVSSLRAKLGAMQNRLEYSITNLRSASENMTSANSRIRDTDMAKEMAKYTQCNVLTQAAQAMLAQANTQPQSILQLLQ